MSPSVSIKKLKCDKFIVSDNAFAESVKYSLLILDVMFHFLFVLVCTFRLKFTQCHDVIVK